MCEMAQLSFLCHLTIREVFDYLGYFATVVILFQIIAAIILWVMGIAPVLIRLGNGLARRKIALFAKGDEASSLESLLKDSKLFKHTNIRKITSQADLGIAEGASIFLVYWPQWKTSIRQIVNKKKDSTVLIIYAPQDQGIIDPEDISFLGNQRNAVVSNFRGRLLNDIVTGMITTSYEKN